MYSLEEEKTYRELIVFKLNTIQEDIKETRIQTTKTNGRVNSLEKSRIQVWTAIGVLTTLGGIIIYLSVMAIDAKIQRGIETALTNRVQSVEYEK